MQIMRDISKRKMLTIGFILLLLLILPLVISDQYIMHLVIVTCIWGIVVTNWNLTLGYGGMFHIAQISLFAVGGYSAGVFITQLGISPWLGLIIGGFSAALMSLVIGLPSLRVQGIYLILLTFAFHYSVKEIVDHLREITGGSMGLMVPGFTFAGNRLSITAEYYMVLALLLFSIFLNWYIVRSYLGKALMAIRDSEVLAASTGINQFKYKMITFVIAASVTGMAGAFYASYLSVIGTEIFSFTLIVNALGMIVIGGIGTLFGPIIGSFLITFFMEIFSQLDVLRPILVGLVIIFVLLFAQNGIVPQFQKIFKKRQKKEVQPLES